jgi:hypothetical protein
MTDQEPTPARTELTVLNADPPKDTQLKFVVHEQQGVSLYPIIDGDIGNEPVPATEDLVVGRDYTAIGLMGEYVRWTVGRDTHGKYQITSGSNMIGVLERGGDERNCWRVTGSVNIRGLKKLELKTSS